MDEQPTDDLEPRITGHPFQPGRPPQEPDSCGWDGDGFLCGYSRAEHADQGEREEDEVPVEERWQADRVEDERAAEAERWDQSL